ncbi:MAG: UDP-N-acetylglucosamine 2-epimerase (non-hydrolyzing) [Planctomycetota bacterium]
MKVLLVAGARPNFVKIAPLVAALSDAGGFETRILHTGQHYDEELSRVFFDELGIPRPDENLGVGSASHAVQTARIMTGFEPVLERERPDLVVVVGDVNSTVACSLTAVKLGVPVAHVEAGLRSFDRTMPEEVNRILTDAISDLLFVTEPSGVANLEREGVNGEVHLVGNVMIDTLLRHRDRALARAVPERLGVAPGEYVLLTLHRPANVDDPAILGGVLDAVEEIASKRTVLFPVHPRTRTAIDAAGLSARISAVPGLRGLDPLGYLDFIGLLNDARAVLTDSGGIQEETTVLGVPCLTLRDNTERPITVDEGTNRLVGLDSGRILRAYAEIEAEGGGGVRRPDLWDGEAARRIVAILAAREVE